MSANTEFYGLFPVRMGPFEGIRHVVRPSLSYRYQPDYTSDFWGYFNSYEDTLGNEIEYPVVSGIPTIKQSRLAVSIGNVFQTKRVRVDTTGRGDAHAGPAADHEPGDELQHGG